MATATNPEALLRDARDSLAAAEASAATLAAHPELLPIERMHASGTDGAAYTGPLLELQLGDNRLQTLTDWANRVGVEIADRPAIASQHHAATLDVDGVRLLVSTYTPWIECVDRYGFAHEDHIDDDGICANCGAELPA